VTFFARFGGADRFTKISVTAFQHPLTP